MGGFYAPFYKCKKEALKYNTRNEFCIKSKGAYDSARKHKWLEECCLHMKVVKKPIGFWNSFENFKNELLPICEKLGHFPTKKELMFLTKYRLYEASLIYGGLLKVKKLFEQQQLIPIT